MTEQDKGPSVIHIEAGMIERTARSMVYNYMIMYFNAPKNLDINDIFIVWSAKVLQNWKAIVAAPGVYPGRMFEVTFDGDHLQAYVDVYKKDDQQIVHFAMPAEEAKPL